MSNLTKLLQLKSELWINEEKKKAQSVVGNLIKHIEQEKLRQPQKEAIKVYLWLKFVGENRKLSEIVKDGLLYDEDFAKQYENYRVFKENYTTQFLNQFLLENKVPRLYKRLVNDPEGEETDWNKFLDELLHNFDYPSYLFSLPMGAGKTYLMACFIYLDLYFATLYKYDRRFAHNFVVFAPQATKTAILPSLQSIKKFNPEWVLPKDEAERIKQIVQIEILDALSSKRKDKLHGNNPNLEKVNRITQTKDFGLVFITNAEKVVLEKYSDDDKYTVDKKSLLYDEEKALEIKKYNDLREKLSQIPYLSVVLDEVHHVYGTTGKGEKKLREAVNILNQHGNVVSVLGLSGTPYVKTSVKVGDEEIKLNQIQDIVYNFPLNQGIGKFLKIPEIRGREVKEDVFIKEALTDFFSEFDVAYGNGTKSKIAFYCPSVEALNKEVLPVVQEWYEQNRSGKNNEIFRYYSTPKEKEYQLPKNSLAIFNNLDKEYSDKRVILLVAVGTEGWDCKSLTAVALPRRDTTKNFVLQTTARCLREVDNASKEKALIFLGGGNYEMLDTQLQDNYHLSVSDLKQAVSEYIPVIVRKPKLGKLKYKQITTKYNKLVKRTEKRPEEILKDFSFETLKKAYQYDTRQISGTVGDASITGETTYEREILEEFDYAFSDFVYDIAKASYGKYSEAELYSKYEKELKSIYGQLVEHKGWISANPILTTDVIAKEIIAKLMEEISYEVEELKHDVEIDLLEWDIDNPQMTLRTSSGSPFKFMPRNAPDNAKFFKYKDILEEEYFNKDNASNNIDPHNISYNYIPYKMDSDFERNALEEMLKMSELRGLEVYFSGYKDSNLQSFWIQTPVGVYTPDFLILKRDEKDEIAKVLIIETKGGSYYDDDFKRKEKFVKETFMKHNPNFNFEVFVDTGGNDFSRWIGRFKELIEML